MHVSFISLCEKTSVKRTRRILDRYALRTGHQTWQSRITTEALDDVCRALKAASSKTTSVACYKNDGRDQMRLLWIVGSRRQFGENGETSVGTIGRKKYRPKSWERTAALIARTAGLNHDIGKGTVRFQEKLREALKKSQPLGDRIRHEWMSLLVYEHWRERMQRWQTGDGGTSPPRLHESFAEIRPAGLPEILQSPSSRGGRRVNRPIATARSALDMVTLTHHGLLNAEQGGLRPGKEGHVREAPQFKDQPDVKFNKTFENAAFAKETEKKLWSLTRRVEERGKDYGTDPEYWRAIGLVARLAVIAADHSVSGIDHLRVPQTKAKGKMFANTSRAQKALNQPLDWHLENVSEEAGRWVNRLAGLDSFPGLSELSRDTLVQPSGPGDFEWQDRAANALRVDTNARTLGSLVFNMASTGSGKTIANLKLAEAMTPSETPCRVSIALNLRSLTLQTTDSLCGKAGLQPSEVSCLVGDTFNADADKAMDAARTANTDSDETPVGDMVIYGDDNSDAPDWFEWWSKKQKNPPRVRRFMGSPCLVSTVDYLIQAGEPGRQGHHVMASLRVASSDLILDEIDNYGAKALVAVSRVVMMAALFGRNVIASSATLSEPVASAITEAFLTGSRMRLALHGHGTEQRDATTVSIGLVDNVLEPEVLNIHSKSEFTEAFLQRLENLMMNVTKQPVTRRAYIQQEMVALEKSDAMESFGDTVAAAIERLHSDHAWVDSSSGKRVSFGVVRVANIRPCVELANRLQKPGWFVTAYHAQDLTARRWLKERQMDKMFYRTADPSAPVHDEQILACLRKSTEQDLTFIVVATPVEEVGRDHDFDWAVIEPSGVASIVQMAGRVNRHRKTPVTVPNIALLDRNLRSLKGKRVCFKYPGNGQDIPHEEQNLTHLLADAVQWQSDNTLPITAALQSGLDGQKPLLAEYDLNAYRNAAKGGVQTIKANDSSHCLAWLTKDHYLDYPLRDGNQLKLQLRIAHDPVEGWQMQAFQNDSSAEGYWSATPLIDIGASDLRNQWGTWSFSALSERIVDLQNPWLAEKAMQFEVRYPQIDEELVFDEMFGGH